MKSSNLIQSVIPECISRGSGFPLKACGNDKFTDYFVGLRPPRNDDRRYFVVILGILLFFQLIFSTFVWAGIREPAVAGQFYPADAKELAAYVDSLLAKVNPVASKDEPIAFLVPHAGYPFSGEVAAHVYKIIAQIKPQTIIFIGTAHHYPLAGGSIFPKGSFKTPLGEVVIDSETAKKIIDRDKSLIDVTELAHEKEHSIEVQLPFLQRALPQVQIVPIIIGNSDFEIAIRLGNAIAEVVKENNESHHRTILIVSTDLSHYPNKADAERVDRAILETLKPIDPKVFWVADQKLLSEKIPNLACTMCGNLAMTVGLQAAKQMGANQTTILKYANSADVVLGDTKRVVGYAAVVFEKKEEVKVDFSKSDLENLTHDEKKELLRIARMTLEEFVDSKSPQVNQSVTDSATPVAIFVTLKKNGELSSSQTEPMTAQRVDPARRSELRGCIGSPEPTEPIAKAIQKYTIKAASEDPRFSPVKAEELSSINIEISVLSPKRKVASSTEIEPNKHGVIIESGSNRGLFLPQVWETIPEKEKFLNTLASEKAGLPADAWKNPGTNLYVFEVVSFSEKEFVE